MFKPTILDSWRVAWELGKMDMWPIIVLPWWLENLRHPALKGYLFSEIDIVFVYLAGKNK